MAPSLDNEPQEHPTVKPHWHLKSMALFYGFVLDTPPFSVYILCLHDLMCVRTLLMMTTLDFICPASTSLHTFWPSYPITHLISPLRCLADILIGQKGTLWVSFSNLFLPPALLHLVSSIVVNDIIIHSTTQTNTHKLSLSPPVPSSPLLIRSKPCWFYL